MGQRIASILAEIGIDSSKFTSGAKGVTGGIQQMLGGFGKLIPIVGGASIAFKALADYAQVAIDAASNLSETEAKVGVVFENQADSIRMWGETASSSMGMSANAAMAAAGTYGNLFRAMGITTSVSADMSTALVELAADLASFNNMDPQEVLDKLRAGLSGETEPLKTLGVNLNQAAIQAKALESGLWDGVGSLDAAAKAQSTYALIMEQTTLAQGDFARTSEGLANQQRRLKAASEDLAGTIGSELLPAYTTVVTAMADMTTNVNESIKSQRNFGNAMKELGYTFLLSGIYIKDWRLVLAGSMEDEVQAYLHAILLGEGLNALGAEYLALSESMSVADNAGTDYYQNFQTVANEEQRYKENLSEIRTNIRELTAEKQTLIEKYGAESSKVAEITGKLHEQGLAAQGLADEHELATQRIILGFIEQELAMNGLTREESGYLIELGTKWGIYGEDMKGAYESAMDSVDNFVRMQNNVIPKQTIELNVIVTGDGAGILMGGSNKAGSKMIEMGKAKGGPVMNGVPYIVGEAGPELFVPNASGNIVPNNKLSGGGNMGGGVDYYTLARAVAEAFVTMGIGR